MNNLYILILFGVYLGSCFQTFGDNKITTMFTEIEYPESMASGTVPLLVIQTEENKPILDKINYIPGILSLNIPEGDQWKELGENLDNVKIEIRGRGNWTWKSDKKAFKIKFEKKQSLLGMPKHKHFALISYDPFYTTDWLAPCIGFELGRLLNFGWVPYIQPVELVLNGEYRGIYLLVESIKTGEERLNIITQDDNNENPLTIPYGWLVELDNQSDDNQIIIVSNSSNGELKITYKEPEELSLLQEEWLVSEFTRLTQLIEDPRDSETWTESFDLTSLAKYMIVRELLHDVDGYSGSQYFYKPHNMDKWFAGPLWDMELWPYYKSDWIANNSAWSLLNWVGDMMNSKKLNKEFIKEWNNYYPFKFEQIYDFIKDFEKYKQADIANSLRWPQETYPLENKIQSAINLLSHNAEWIDEHKDWFGLSTNLENVKEDNLIISINNKHVSLKSSKNFFNILVTNITGKTLINFYPESNNVLLDFSQFESGIYIINCKLDENYQIFRYKFMIK